MKLAQEANHAEAVAHRIGPDTEADLGQTVFPTALLSILGWIAAADSNSTPHERGHAERTARQVGLRGSELEVALRLFERGSRTGYAPDKQLQTIKRALGQRADLRRQFVERLFEGACSDGRLTAQEAQRVQHVADTLGFSEMEVSVMQAVSTAAQA